MLYISAAAAKAQQDPQFPWFLIGVTFLAARQSTVTAFEIQEADGACTWGEDVEDYALAPK